MAKDRDSARPKNANAVMRAIKNADVSDPYPTWDEDAIARLPPYWRGYMTAYACQLGENHDGEDLRDELLYRMKECWGSK